MRAIFQPGGNPEGLAGRIVEVGPRLRQGLNLLPDGYSQVINHFDPIEQPMRAVKWLHPQMVEISDMYGTVTGKQPFAWSWVEESALAFEPRFVTRRRERPPSRFRARPPTRRR